MTETTFEDPSNTKDNDVDFKIIKVSPETHRALRKLIEMKGETFDDIIKRLIKEHEERERHG